MIKLDIRVNRNELMRGENSNQSSTWNQPDDRYIHFFMLLSRRSKYTAKSSSIVNLLKSKVKQLIIVRSERLDIRLLLNKSSFIYYGISLNTGLYWFTRLSARFLLNCAESICIIKASAAWDYWFLQRSQINYLKIIYPYNWFWI